MIFVTYGITEFVNEKRFSAIIKLKQPDEKKLNGFHRG